MTTPKTISSRIAAVIREMRQIRQANRGLPSIILAFTEQRGVLAAVEEPANPILARGVLEFVRSEGPLPDPIRPVRFHAYFPHEFRKPVPRGRSRPRSPHGVVTGLASRLIVPSPVGMAAVFVDGEEARFVNIGRTPASAQLLLSLQPNLAATVGSVSWFRAEPTLSDLLNGEPNTLREFFTEKD